MKTLDYLTGDRFCPTHTIQTVEAEFFAQVNTEKRKHLEGICFDRNGDAYFTTIYNGSIMKLDIKTKKLTRIFQDPTMQPCAIKIHKDGRLFICSAHWPSAYAPTSQRPGKKGGLFVINPDGSDFAPILQGWCIDDIVFDSKGGIYFTHYIGDLFNPIGGVYYLEPDLLTVTPVLENMRAPNGVALSKDENILWVTETVTGNIIRHDLSNMGHTCMVYHLDGYCGCDSCSIDDDDNLYVAHLYAGRVVVLNPNGFPIAQILLPERDQGHCLHVTHPMVAPGRKELYITGADDNGENGSWIFRAPSFAAGNTNAYQFK